MMSGAPIALAPLPLSPRGGPPDLRVVADVARLTARALDPADALEGTTAILRKALGVAGVAVYVRSGASFELQAASGAEATWAGRTFDAALVDAAVATAGGIFEEPGVAGGQLGQASLSLAAVPIDAAQGGTWGLLCAVADRRRRLVATDVELLAVAAAQLGAAMAAARARDGLARRLRKSDALRTIAADVGGKLDLGQILARLVDDALALFEASRAAVFLRRPDGTLEAGAARCLSEAYLEAVRVPPPDGLLATVMERGGTVHVSGCAQRRVPASAPATAPASASTEPVAASAPTEPVAASLADHVVPDGFDTECCASLGDAADGPLGVLAIYHDQRHDWSGDDLATLGELAARATVAIRTAQNYSKVTNWAAQLQSIQHLGSRLSRLTTVGEIAAAIASELREVIDYQNVRVYRVTENRLLAVAQHGHASEYEGETPQSLQLALGQGITGWVAEHGVAQYLPNAAQDPRTQTIPGTDDDVPESMLLAPMLFEGRVLGVLVLSKLGLHQFGDDDLRLLVIYAMFAAQAMANADTTARLRAQTALLEQQLQSQRVLLQITESILSTLDPRAIVDQITDRIFALVRYDRIAVELGGSSPEMLLPVASREMRDEPAGLDRPPSVLEVPLRRLGAVAGSLRLTRYGDEPPFAGHEVELARLFAGHVSIALQNAEIHQEVEVRARTDDLTGLFNQGALAERLESSVAVCDPFSLIMLDLDDFKSINDRMGHQAGDMLLQEIAWTIVRAARETDAVFRYGGDEFALVLPRTPPEVAHEVAERVRAALYFVRVGRRSQDPRPGGDETAVTASIGIATFPEDGATPEEVLLAADRACYVAKRSGRDRIAAADEGRALAEEFTLQAPTPVDAPTLGSRRRQRGRGRPVVGRGIVTPV